VVPLSVLPHHRDCAPPAVDTLTHQRRRSSAQSPLAPQEDERRHSWLEAGTLRRHQPSKQATEHTTQGGPAMARRFLTVPAAVFALVLAALGFSASPALAECSGGLIVAGHAAALVKATSLAAWHGGYEHYVTGFEFTGRVTSFGYIIPLPGVPTKIQKGGDWTLERLEGEIGEGPLAFKSQGTDALFTAAAPSVQVLQQVKIDALNVTVVRGGGPDVARWANKNGFDLSPDAPKVLGRYSDAGAIFALAKYDVAGASEGGLIRGQGVVVQFTIPTKATWMPLRILAFGKAPDQYVDAELFVLTDDRPSFSPSIDSIQGMQVRANERASKSLLSDLRGDRGMSWVPGRGMWFTALNVHAPASTVTTDLSIDGGGPTGGRPSYPLGSRIPVSPGWPFWLALLGGSAALLAAARRERIRATR
jgi:hypothetical protein